MKTLTLLRHAKSSWDDPSARDFDRPLNRRGRKAARAMGKAIREQGIAFDRILASPAARVVGTLEDLAEGYGGPIDPVFDHRIYMATAATLLKLVRETDDTAERLLVVGHNPGMEALALMLIRDDGNGLRSEMSVKYPTAALAEIELPVDHWRDVDLGRGRLDRFIRPRDLDPALGPED
jgi:phosphohistidine phosphatase